MTVTTGLLIKPVDALVPETVIVITDHVVLIIIHPGITAAVLHAVTVLTKNVGVVGEGPGVAPRIIFS